MGGDCQLLRICDWCKVRQPHDRIQEVKKTEAMVTRVRKSSSSLPEHELSPHALPQSSCVISSHQPSLEEHGLVLAILGMSVRAHVTLFSKF